VLLACTSLASGTLLALFWGAFGLLLARFWRSFGALLVCFWHASDTLLARFWHTYDLLLTCFWRAFRVLLACFWRASGVGSFETGRLEHMEEKALSLQRQLVSQLSTNTRLGNAIEALLSGEPPAMLTVKTVAAAAGGSSSSNGRTDSGTCPRPLDDTAILTTSASSYSMATLHCATTADDASSGADDGVMGAPAVAAGSIALDAATTPGQAHQPGHSPPLKVGGDTQARNEHAAHKHELNDLRSELQRERVATELLQGECRQLRRTKDGHNSRKEALVVSLREKVVSTQAACARAVAREQALEKRADSLERRRGADAAANTGLRVKLESQSKQLRCDRAGPVL
jgi:hypothetical protein